MENFDMEKKVSNTYLENRKRILEYSYTDMNLRIEDDSQVYIALFDIPVKSEILGLQTQSLALIYGLNTHVYSGNGDAFTGYEKNPSVAGAMQSLFISSPQILDFMKVTNDFDFYNSTKVRAYLKTRRGIHFKELDPEIKEDSFLLHLMINIYGKLKDNS